MEPTLPKFVARYRAYMAVTRNFIPFNAKVRGMSGKPTMSNEYILIKLLSIARINLSKFTPEFHPNTSQEKQLVAFFEIENTSEYPWGWNLMEFEFIDKEGYTFDPELPQEVVSQSLPRGWYLMDSEIPPGARAKVLIKLGKFDEEQPIAAVLYKTDLANTLEGHVDDKQLSELYDEKVRLKMDLSNVAPDEISGLPD